MKKLIVLLLAFAMVGAVSAQVTTAVSLSGQVDFVNQDGQGQFVQWGSGYDLLTFKASDKDGKFGVSATLNKFLDTVTTDAQLPANFRDWNAWYKGKYTKAFVGKLRNGDFRMTMQYGSSHTVFTASGRIGGADAASDYGILVETLPVNGLTFGVNLPYGTTAASAVDVLKKADVGVKYAVKDVGTFFALADLNMVTPANVLNAGFTLTSVKNLNVVGITQLKFNADTYKAALGFNFTGVKNLNAYAEAAYTYTAGVNAYSVWAQGEYNITDPLSVIAGAFYGSAGYDVYADVDYAYGNGLTSELSLGFDGAVYAAATLYYTLSL